MAKVVYTAEATVAGGRANGRGWTPGGELEVDLRFPKELGGAGDGTNPEQLFAIGYAACFQTVLGLIGQRKRLEAEDSTIESKVMLMPVDGGRFELGVRLDITLPSIEDSEQAAQLVRDTHQTCPYSNATRGNIDVALVVNGVPLTE